MRFFNGSPMYGHGIYGAGFAGGNFWDMLVSPGGIFMGIFVLIIVGVVIYLLVSRSRDRQEFTQYYARPRTEYQVQPGKSFSAPGKDPVQIVKERYARGEITKEEFEQLKRDLQDFADA